MDFSVCCARAGHDRGTFHAIPTTTTNAFYASASSCTRTMMHMYVACVCYLLLRYKLFFVRADNWYAHNNTRRTDCETVMYIYSSLCGSMKHVRAHKHSLNSSQPSRESRNRACFCSVCTVLQTIAYCALAYTTHTHYYIPHKHKNATLCVCCEFVMHCLKNSVEHTHKVFYPYARSALKFKCEWSLTALCTNCSTRDSDKKKKHRTLSGLGCCWEHVCAVVVYWNELCNTHARICSR